MNIWEPLQMIGGFGPRETFHDNSTDPIAMQDKPPGVPGSTATSTFDTGAKTTLPLPGENNPAGRPPPSPFPTVGQPQPPSAPVPDFWHDRMRGFAYLFTVLAEHPELVQETIDWLNARYAAINAGK